MGTPHNSTTRTRKAGDKRQPDSAPEKRRRTKAPVDALDAIGLAAFARTIGVAPDTALAAVSTMLTGLAGPDAWIQSPWGPCRLPKLDLLTFKDDFKIQRLIDILSSPLSLLSRRLVHNMGTYNPTAIELLASGPFASGAASKHADPEMRDKILRRHSDALMQAPGPGESGLLRHDLAFEPESQRCEAILHPQFLLSGVDGRNLRSRVEGCHLRTALVIQPVLGLIRQGSEPARVIKQLVTLLDGTTIRARSGAIDRGRDSSIPAKAHAILSLAKDEVEALSAMGADHLNRFLWLVESASRTSKPGDGSEAFLSAYQSAIEKILGLRREGRGLIISFESRETMAKFEAELRLYEADIDRMAPDAGQWARGLPQTLFWALAFLRLSLPENRGPDDESLLAASFAAARRLVESHVGQVLIVTNASLLADRCLLAGRIVEEVTKRAPLKFSSLVRSFNRQEKSRFDPVIDALLETGVLVRDEDKRLDRGPVDLADVEEALVKRFVEPG